MAEPKDSTKKTTKSLMGGLMSLLRGSNKDSEVLGKKASDSEVLGGIYKLMVQKENFNKLEHERRTNYLEEEESEQARRHAEILKALTVRRKPAPKKAKAKEPVMPGMPKARKPKAPAPGPKAPAPGPKAPAPTAPAPGAPGPKAPAPTAPAPTAPAPTTPAPTAPTAPKVSDAARKQAEEQARKQAEEQTRKQVEEAARKKAAKDAEEAAKKAEDARRAQDAAKKAEETTKRETAERLKREERERLAREAQEKAKKAEEVKKKVEQPTAAPAPTAATGVQTATKVVTTAAITSAALIGKESLAANIAKYESLGSSGKSFGKDEYNAYNKGTVGNTMIGADKPIDFSKMTITEYLRRGSLDVKDPDRLFAVGRYQIIPKTMENLIKNLKIDPDKTTLNRDTQDMLFTKGLTTSIQGRAAVDNYIKGKPGVTRDDAIMALAKEFASVGVPYDTERVTRAYKNKKGEMVPEQRIPIKRGQSYYTGIGGNKAHNSPDEVGIALDADREKNLKLLQSQQQVTNLGNQIDQSSRENTELKKTLRVDGKSQTTTNINVAQPVAPQQKSGTVVDDSSPYSRKTKQ